MSFEILLKPKNIHKKKKRKWRRINKGGLLNILKITRKTFFLAAPSATPGLNVLFCAAPSSTNEWDLTSSSTLLPRWPMDWTSSSTLLPRRPMDDETSSSSSLLPRWLVPQIGPPLLRCSLDDLRTGLPRWWLWWFHF